MSKVLINKRFNDLLFFLKNNFEIENYSDLANKLEVSNSRISEIRKNRMGLTSDILIKLSELFNVDTHWLLTGEGSMLKIGRFSAVIPDCTSCKEKDLTINNLNLLIGELQVKLNRCIPVETIIDKGFDEKNTDQISQ